MAAVRKSKTAGKATWKKPPPELVDRFERALRHSPKAQPRLMFGYPAVFVNGNMMAGLFQESMMLRLSARDLAVFQADTGATLFEPMPGRVMREYAVVPRAIVASEEKLGRWLGCAFCYASALPAKATKPRGTKRRSRP